MNVHATPQRTPAETALIEAFGERLGLLPGDSEVMVQRDGAIEMIKAGFPTRRIESWHYTDLRRLLGKVPEFDATASVRAPDPILEGSGLVTLINGAISGKPSLAEGISFASLAEKLTDGSAAAELKTYGSDDTIGAINAAFVADGVSLDIAAGTELEKPVELQNLQAGGQTHVRMVVNAGAGSRAVIVERQSGEDAGLVSSVSQLTVGDGAEVTWLIIQEQPETAQHLAQFKAEIGADAKLTLFIMNAGGKLVRQEVHVKVSGEGSDFQLRGVNLLSVTATPT